MFADISGQQSFRPEFGGPTHSGRFLTREPDNPRPRLRRNLPRPAGARQVREGLPRAEGERFADTAPDRIAGHLQAIRNLCE